MFAKKEFILQLNLRNVVFFINKSSTKKSVYPFFVFILLYLYQAPDDSLN